MKPLAFVAPFVMSLLCFVICFPIVMLVACSFMDNAELALKLGGVVSSGTGLAQVPLFPMYPTLESYLATLLDTPAYHALIQNSAIIVVGVLAGQFLIATPAAWVLARYDFRGRNAIFFIYVLLMMMPFQVVMLPNYLVLNSLGINNTLLAVILPGAVSAFPVFIMTHFFKTIPSEIIESARLDGTSEIQIFLKIGIPLGSSGIFAALVLGFFEYWNLVEQPLAYLRDQSLWPISLFQPTLTYDDIGLVFAAAIIAAIPAILVFLLGKDYLEQGIATTTKRA
ncbi:carbohydrate ABC transporter permease [Eggerthella lenta]|uniref:carbohydrate ABC transporter permease n=1 Tax=Eggerthella lenta TaxID=84112 RepID=UPI000DF7B0B1|nr:carbohydrate ABC transporter permease [Eggerthella lenta]RDC08418.1 sugar permease [Eggerthella lenta]